MSFPLHHEQDGVFCAPSSCVQAWNRPHLLCEGSGVLQPTALPTLSSMSLSSDHEPPEHPHGPLLPQPPLLLRVDLLACFGVHPSFPSPLQFLNVSPAWEGWGRCPRPSSSLGLASFLSSSFKSKVLKRTVSICSIHCYLLFYSLIFFTILFFN